MKNPMVDASQLALRAVSCGPPASHVGLKDIEFPRTNQEVVEGFLTRRSLVEQHVAYGSMLLKKSAMGRRRATIESRAMTS